MFPLRSGLTIEPNRGVQNWIREMVRFLYDGRTGYVLNVAGFYFKATGPVCFVAWLHAMDASKSGVWEKVRRPDSSASSDDEPPPSNVCTRHLCGWCLLNVTHKDGESLKCMYRDECMALENSLASPPETNRELHTLNMLVQQCLRDLSSAEIYAWTTLPLLIS